MGTKVVQALEALEMSQIQDYSSVYLRVMSFWNASHNMQREKQFLMKLKFHATAMYFFKISSHDIKCSNLPLFNFLWDSEYSSKSITKENMP